MEITDAPPAADERSVFARFVELLAPEGREVVEVGGCLPGELAAAAGIRSWWAVDPRNEPGLRDGPVRALACGAERVPLPAAAADLVFSCNALQHVHPLDAVLSETHRLLRPGGRAYFHFGPVWSAPDGSHVEGVRWRGRRLDFWDGPCLPAWSHLVLDEGELAAVLASAFDAGLARTLARWVFRTGWLNRVPLHGFLEAIARSPLRAVSVRGTTAFGYDYAPPPVDHPLAERLAPDAVAARAAAAHGIAREHLDVRDLELVLERPS